MELGIPAEGELEIPFKVVLKGWGKYAVVERQKILSLSRALYNAFLDDYELYNEEGARIVFDHLSDDSGHHEHTGHLAANTIILKHNGSA